MKKVYIIRDANGDADQTFLAEVGDASHIRELAARLEKIGHYLDSETIRGEVPQLIDRVAFLEKLAREQS